MRRSLEGTILVCAALLIGVSAYAQEAQDAEDASSESPTARAGSAAADATSLFELLDMNEFADTPNGRLSAGMKQKVSLARTKLSMIVASRLRARKMA